MGDAAGGTPAARSRKASTVGEAAAAGPVEKIIDAVNNNLGSPEAFAIIDTSELMMEDWERVDELFGLNLITDTPDVSEDVKRMIFERQVARDNKDFARSDELRDLLKAQGISVEDTPNGPVWQYI